MVSLRANPRETSYSNGVKQRNYALFCYPQVGHSAHLHYIQYIIQYTWEGKNQLINQ